MSIQAPKGTKDILPSEVYRWRHVEEAFAGICSTYGYKEIRLPVFEYTELFERGVGDTTDIVQKEMYTFNDKGGRSLTLRPEGTAGVVRSYIQNGMASMPQPVKLFYNITAYRYENVQKGRYREFHQLGVEAFGAPGPSIDVEIILMINGFFRQLGLNSIALRINSLGCPECRKEYNAELKGILSQKLEKLCTVCNERFGRNPLRILDCKEERCKEAVKAVPCISDRLCASCEEHFSAVKAGLDNLGISYEVDRGIVRGLDYYTKTVFEFVSSNVGTQGTVCGGGRYDNLIEAFGGTHTPGIGFGLGVERLLLEMESQAVEIPGNERTDIYVASIGQSGEYEAQKLINRLRQIGVYAEKDHMNRSIRAQLKHADRTGARYVVVIGDDEVQTNKTVLRNMKTGEEKDVSIDSIPERFKKNLNT